MGKRKTNLNAVVRKTIGVGGSILLTLPPRYCIKNQLKPRSEVVLIYNASELLVKAWPSEPISALDSLLLLKEKLEKKLDDSFDSQISLKLDLLQMEIEKLRENEK